MRTASKIAPKIAQTLYKSKKKSPKNPLWVLSTCVLRREVNPIIMGWENVQRQFLNVLSAQDNRIELWSLALCQASWDTIFWPIKGFWISSEAKLQPNWTKWFNQGRYPHILCIYCMDEFLSQFVFTNLTSEKIKIYPICTNWKYAQLLHSS